MKFTAEELLLAAQVRALVAERLAIDTPPNMSERESQQWRNAQLPAYVRAAMEELELIAEQIKRP